MTGTLLGCSTEELRVLVSSGGQPEYRGSQLAEWIYRRGARSFDEMTNLPADFRTRLSQKYEIGRSCVMATQRSADGTIKLLLEMGGGARVESVGLPYEDRTSCCVSTQVGCPVGCVFCATGLSGYTRNLIAGEIVDQVLSVQETLRDRVDHVTFMGMGEPLANYEATLKALTLLNTEMGISARNLTVSTVGLVPGIVRLAGEKLQITLAVSLHAPTDELRRQLIPRMTKWTVTEIIDACREYVRLTGRRVTFEYLLLDGVNDGVAEAYELGRVLRGLNCHVNLIPYNGVADLGFRASSAKQVKTFREVLERSSIQVTQRVQRGADIDAACGQLRRRAGA